MTVSILEIAGAAIAGTFRWWTSMEKDSFKACYDKNFNMLFIELII